MTSVVSTARGTQTCSSRIRQLIKQPGLQALAQRSTAIPYTDPAKRRTPRTQLNSSNHLQEYITADCRLPFQYVRQLSDMEQLTADLQNKQHSPGAHLLELLAAFEVARSNMLRPSSYFIDFPTSPQQLTEALQLQQYVSQLTAPVYTNMQLLLLLLATVQQALQQLAAATAAAAAAAAEEDGNECVMQQQVVLGRVTFNVINGDIAVHAEGAAAAAGMAAAAIEAYQTTNRLEGAAAQDSVRAVQAALSAVDTALNSTIPFNSSSSSTGRRSNSSSSSNSRHSAQGQYCIHNLMVCRQLLASWLPPLAAEAEGSYNKITAVSNVLHDSITDSDSDALNHHPKSTDNITESSCINAAAVDDDCRAASDSVTQTYTSATAAAAAAVDGDDSATAAVAASEPRQVSADSSFRKSLSTKQLLRSALSTLSVISSSSSSSSSSSGTNASGSQAAAAPLLLMTEDQAAVLEPLLIEAGLQQSRPVGGSRQQQQQQQQQESITPWVPLVSHRPDVTTAADQSDPSNHCTILVQCCDHDDLLLQTSLPLHVHDGPGGQLLVTDLVTVTDQAHQMMQDWQQQRQRQQQGQRQQQRRQQAPKDGNDHIIIPAGAPLRLLRVTTDVLQLLLRCHPNPGVRQLMYVGGLLPLLQLQEQVLEVILGLRQQLAAQHGVPEYTSLVLSGCCLGTAAAAAKLLRQLLPVVHEYACAEYHDLCAAAARSARSARSSGYVDHRDGDDDVIQPWDLAFFTNKLNDRISDLDWGRDIAPYFTLPGLIGRIDALLAATCGLRLLPAAEVAAGESQFDAVQQQQLQCLHSTELCDHTVGMQPWGPHVMHLVLIDSSNSTSSGSSSKIEQQQQQQYKPAEDVVLGHIFVELVPGYGFPFSTLLQLPKPRDIIGSSSSAEPAAAAAAAAAARCAVSPGSVVIRLPVPMKTQPGTSAQQQQQQQQQQCVSYSPDDPALYLLGPAALQALLHELGHAVSYLCPFANIIAPQQQQQHHQQHQQHQQRWPAVQYTDTADNVNTSFSSSSSSSSSSGSDINSSSAYSSWLFSAAAGSSGLCLLCSPAAGVDMRELSSHVFEHWCRQPAAILVLSRHERLGVPLPQRTAVQLPHLMMAAAGPGAGSSMKLYTSLLEARADLIIHNDHHDHDQHIDQIQDQDKDQDKDLDPALQQQQQQRENARQPQVLQDQSLRVQAAREWLHPQNIPAGAALLDEVEELAAEGPIGGSKAAYVMAKLLAAAAWNALGLELAVQQPTGKQAKIDTLTNSSSSSSSDCGTDARAFVSPGVQLKEVLLRSGCFQPGHHTVMQLLGGQDVLLPQMTEVDDAVAGHVHGYDDGCYVEKKDGAAQRTICGWLPNLGHSVYQDLDLL